jgi:phage repressor protein C with HTH and peptisase S24 domain
VETVGARIRREREAQGIVRADLCKRTGIGYSTLAELERGGMQTSTKLHTIADALGVATRWLETGKGPKHAADTEKGWPDVLGYSQAVGLGNGAEAQEYAETHALKFRASSLAKKRLHVGNLRVFYGRGDSMLPRIRNGDAVLFDTSDTKPRDGAVFVVMVGGEYFAKRCEILDDVVYFRSDNPDGNHGWQKPRRMDAKRDPVTIIGRVRWIGSWED